MVFIVVYVTHENREEANKIVEYLLNKKLIACANTFPIHATSLWTGKIETCEEVVTILKTKKSLRNRVQKEILAIHPYEVPCIMTWDVEANSSYEEWIEKETIK